MSPLGQTATEPHPRQIKQGFVWDCSHRRNVALGAPCPTATSAHLMWGAWPCAQDEIKRVYLGVSSPLHPQQLGRALGWALGLS